MNVKEKNNPTKIEFDPRIIYESLGSKIIESDSIAIAEQIKNAKDAGAMNIFVDFSNISNDIIEIKDDGNGMTLKELKENWFFVATDNKQLKGNQLGGKGIGRFSLFRIANTIEVETISNGTKCIFKLDKQELEQEKLLSDLSINIIEEKSVEKNGTTLYLTDLTKLNLYEIQKELENLNEPHIDKDFTLVLPSNNTTKFLNPTDAISDAPFFAEIEFEADKIIKYNFRCTYSEKIIYENNNISKLQTKIDNMLLTENIGRTKVYIYNFYFDRKYKNITNKRMNQLKEEFLSAYQGISVYRNAFKIYGHGIEDWLKLAEKRLKKSSDNIDNKLTFGYILLDRFQSLGLEEKTNREGFIRSEKSKYFHAIIDLIVTEYGQDRKKAIINIKEFVDNKNSHNSNVTQEDGNTQGTKYTVYQSSQNKDSQGSHNGGRQKNQKEQSQENQNGGNHDFQKSDSKENSNAVHTDSQNRENTLEKKNRFSSNKRIGYFEEEIKNNIKSYKIKELVNEITTLDINRYSFATSFLLRSLVEVSMDEYLKVYFESIKSHFKFYVIDQDKNIKREITNTKTNTVTLKDIPISKKISDFRNYLNKTSALDKRSLNHLNELSKLIDDINLAIHWSDKKVSINTLQTNWNNSKFFLEYICSKI
jgi:hypothetical protein